MATSSSSKSSSSSSKTSSSSSSSKTSSSGGYSSWTGATKKESLSTILSRIPAKTTGTATVKTTAPATTTSSGSGGTTSSGSGGGTTTKITTPTTAAISNVVSGGKGTTTPTTTTYKFDVDTTPKTTPTITKTTTAPSATSSAKSTEAAFWTDYVAQQKATKEAAAAGKPYVDVKTSDNRTLRVDTGSGKIVATTLASGKTVSSLGQEVVLGGYKVDSSGRAVQYDAYGRVVSTVLPSGETVRVVGTGEYGKDLQPIMKVERTPAPAVDTRMSRIDRQLYGEALPSASKQTTQPADTIMSVAKQEAVSTKVSSAYTPQPFPGAPTLTSKVIENVAKGKPSTFTTETISGVKQPTLSQKYAELVKGPMVPSVSAAEATTPMMSIAPEFLTKGKQTGAIVPVDWSKITGTTTPRLPENVVSTMTKGPTVLPKGVETKVTIPSILGVPVLPTEGITKTTLQTIFTKPTLAETLSKPKTLAELEKEIGVGETKPKFWTDKIAMQRAKEDIKEAAEKEITTGLTGYKKTAQQQEAIANKININVQKYQSIQPEIDVLNKEAASLEAEGAAIDLTNLDAVEKFNKKITDFQSKANVVQKKIDEAEQLRKTVIEPAYKEFDKLEQQKLGYLQQQYNAQLLQQKALEKLGEQDILKVKSKEYDVAMEDVKAFAKEKISSPKILDKIVGFETYKAGVGSYLLGKFGLGVVGAGRQVGKLIVEPAKIMKEDIKDVIREVKEGDKKGLAMELSDVGLNVVAPGTTIARSVYDWRDPENVGHKWSSNVDWDVVMGGVQVGTVALGGAVGSAGGATLGAKTAVGAKLSSLGGKALTTLGVAALGAPAVAQGYSVYATGKSYNQLVAAKGQLQKQYDAGEVSKAEYQATKDFLEQEIRIADKARVSPMEALGATAEIYGQIAPSVAGAAYLAAKTAPASTVRPSGVEAKTVMLRETKTKGGMVSEYVAKGPIDKYTPSPFKKGEVVVPTEKLPKEIGYMAKYKEKPVGWSGKSIDTKVTLIPEKGQYPRFTLQRVREYKGWKYITTQKSGAGKSITQVVSPKGKVTRVYDDVPLEVGKGLNQIPEIMVKEELYRGAAPKEASTWLKQTVLETEKVAFKEPVSKGIEVVGRGTKFAKAEEIAKTRPTVTEIFRQEVVRTPEGRLVPRGGEVLLKTTKDKTLVSIAESPDAQLVKSLQRTITGPAKGKPLPSEFSYTIEQVKTPYLKLTSTQDIKGVFRYGFQKTPSPEVQFFKDVGTGAKEVGKAISSIKLPTIGKRGTYYGGLGRRGSYYGGFGGDTTTRVPGGGTGTGGTGTTPTDFTGLGKTTTGGRVVTTPIVRTTPKGLTVSRLQPPSLAEAYLPSALVGATFVKPSMSALLSVPALASISRTAFEVPSLTTTTSRLETTSLTTPKLDVAALTGVSTVPTTVTALVPEVTTVTDVVPITRTTTLTTPSTVAPTIPIEALISAPAILLPLKLPTFGGLGGGLSSGYGRERRSKGMVDWLVANKIATYGEDWFARQQAKAAASEQLFKGTGRAGAALTPFVTGFEGTGITEMIGTTSVPVVDRYSMSRTRKQFSPAFNRASIPHNFINVRAFNPTPMLQQQVRYTEETTPRQRAQAAVERGFGKVVSLKTPGKMEKLFKKPTKYSSIAGKI